MRSRPVRTGRRGMSAIAPACWLKPAAHVAWLRIWVYLKTRDQWSDDLAGFVNVAASQCAHYVELRQTFPRTAEVKRFTASALYGATQQLGLLGYGSISTSSKAEQGAAISALVEE